MLLSDGYDIDKTEGADGIGGGHYIGILGSFRVLCICVDEQSGGYGINGFHGAGVIRTHVIPGDIRIVLWRYEVPFGRILGDVSRDLWRVWFQAGPERYMSRVREGRAQAQDMKHLVIIT